MLFAWNSTIHAWGSISFYHWFCSPWVFFSFFLFSNVITYEICFLVTETLIGMWKAAFIWRKLSKIQMLPPVQRHILQGEVHDFTGNLRRGVSVSAVIKKHRKCLCFCCLRTSVLSSCKQGMWKPLSFICLQLPSREGGMLLAGHLDFVWLW